MVLSSRYRKETHHSPAGLGGHHHIDSVHADAHDVDDSLSGLRVGQAEDAQGLQAGATAARHHSISALGALVVFSHLTLRKLPQSNLLISTSPLTPTLFSLLLSSGWIHRIGKWVAFVPRKPIYCFSSPGVLKNKVPNLLLHFLYSVTLKRAETSTTQPCQLIPSHLRSKTKTKNQQQGPPAL